jgi:hypothetical protein
MDQEYVQAAMSYLSPRKRIPKYTAFIGPDEVVVLEREKFSWLASVDEMDGYKVHRFPFEGAEKTIAATRVIIGGGLDDFAVVPTDADVLETMRKLDWRKTDPGSSPVLIGETRYGRRIIAMLYDDLATWEFIEPSEN